MVKRKNKHRIINVLVSFYERSLNMDDYLASIYYDPKRSGGFGGVDRLYKDVCKNLTMATATCWCASTCFPNTHGWFR